MHSEKVTSLHLGVRHCGMTWLCQSRTRCVVAGAGCRFRRSQITLLIRGCVRIPGVRITGRLWPVDSVTQMYYGRLVQRCGAATVSTHARTHAQHASCAAVRASVTYSSQLVDWKKCCCCSETRMLMRRDCAALGPGPKMGGLRAERSAVVPIKRA